MLKVETLEERIREKASEKLRREIHDATKDIRERCALGYSIECEIGGVKVSLFEMVEAVEKRLYAELLASRQDEAITEFISKVDSLQSQIDELASIQSER